jgi:hypothetical protein
LLQIALTKIEQQEARLNHLNNLSYEIKELNQIYQQLRTDP